MSKKAILVIFAAILIISSASLSFALETDGLVSGTTLTGGQLVFPDGLRPSINPGGLGDALIYGYYNVRGTVNLFNIINTNTTDGAKVRVVYRNGKNSKEILDFSVCLSRGDVWTAFLLDDGTAGHIYGGIDTDTVTAPAITSSGQQFKFGGSTLSDVTGDDTREGYFEVIGLSAIPNYDKNASTTAACTATSGPQNCITTPLDCANWNSLDTPVENVLAGNNNIVFLADLATFSYNATAIADAFPGAIQDPGPGSELSIPTSVAAATTFSASEGIPASGCTVFDWIFMKDTVYTPYDIMASLGGETSLIITFPSRLKCHATTADFVDNDGDINEKGDAMFDCTKHDANDPSKCIAYCAKVGISVWDDQENAQNVLDFSPAVGSCLPNEVNVINVGGSAIWNSSDSFSVNVGSFQLGWMAVDLSSQSNTHAIQWTDDTPTNGTSHGLPAIAYTTQSFFGGVASYMLPALYKTNIDTTSPSF